VRSELETPRLRLRRFRPDDVETLLRWHNDPDLMRHMQKLSFSREEIEQDLERYGQHWEAHGFGLWAAEEKQSGMLVGRIGLAYHRLWPGDPEVGWLVDLSRQGRGLATEGGGACVDYALGELGCDRVVSICTPENTASRRVMEKLGFRILQRIHDPVHDLELLVHSRERQPPGVPDPSDHPGT
jgi:RimJ/RimL family protein N-acetyltransferase